MRAAIAALLLVAACGGSQAKETTPVDEGQGQGQGQGQEAEPGSDEQVAAIEKAMNDLAPAAHQCWAAAAVDDYQLEGSVKLLVDIREDGKATANVQEDTTRDDVLKKCLRIVAEGYRWPKPARGSAVLLPFQFSAPQGQNLIDRDLVPEHAKGARVLLDARNTGNPAASVFELVTPVTDGLLAPTASERAEIWIDLATFEATYLPPKAPRTPEGEKRFLIVAVPGGREDATRRAGVLPASPAQKGKGAVIVPLSKTTELKRPGLGTVRILIEPVAKTGTEGAPMAASLLDIDAGAAVPEHTHDGSTEILYVVSGGGTMTVDGVELAVTPTSVIQVPPGVKHAFTASAATRAIQFYTPAGPEQRFKQK